MRNMMMASAIALMVAAAGSASAQASKTQRAALDTTLEAHFGEYYLDAGFTPDPYVVDIYSGGDIDANSLGGGCRGMVSRAPDVQITYDAGSLPLSFSVDSVTDTTLVINGPDGRWTCDDDSGEGTDPLVTYHNPMSGVYDIYVGAYGGNAGAGQLVISEVGRTSAYSSSSTPYNAYSSSLVDASATALYGEIYLSSGFTGDPRTVRITSGGAIQASDVASGCRGYVARSPDYQVTYDAGSLPLIISVDSASDTTLMINGPNGQWHCDDDGGNGALNPSIRFNNPRSGVYDIWVGSYRSGGGTSATLGISELTSY